MTDGLRVGARRVTAVVVNSRSVFNLALCSCQASESDIVLQDTEQIQILEQV